MEECIWKLTGLPLNFNADKYKIEQIAFHLPDCIESCMCPRTSVKVQDTSASRQITRSLLFQPIYGFCHFDQHQTSGLLPFPMMILNGSCMLYVSMYTLKLRHGLQAQVLRVRMLYWDLQANGQGRIFLWYTWSGKLGLQCWLFRSVDKRSFRTEIELEIRNLS